MSSWQFHSSISGTNEFGYDVQVARLMFHHGNWSSSCPRCRVDVHPIKTSHGWCRHLYTGSSPASVYQHTSGHSSHSFPYNLFFLLLRCNLNFFCSLPQLPLFYPSIFPYAGKFIFKIDLNVRYTCTYMHFPLTWIS